METAWGSRKTRAQADNATPTASSKLVQLQRQSLPTGPALSTTVNSTVATSSSSSNLSTPYTSSSTTTATATATVTTSSSSTTTSNTNGQAITRGALDSGNSTIGANSSNIKTEYVHGSMSGAAGAGISESISAAAATGVGGVARGVASSSLSTIKGPGIGTGLHPLHFNWVFWFMHRAPGSKIVNYESAMKKIATFGSVEDFWAVYSHMKRPHELPAVSDYHLFKQGVRPVWEDATNINGGKWIVRLKKGLAARYWEDLIVAVIGDQFDVGSEICGLVLSIRGSEDILSLWNQSAHEGRINLKIRDTMKRVLSLPADTIMEYKTHNDALKDNSSFRNTDVFR